MAYQNNRRQGAHNRRQAPQKWNDVLVKFKDETYVNEAEEVIKEMKDKNFTVIDKGNKDELTTSQIRKLLSMTSSLYDEVRTYGIEQAIERIVYLRVQFVYQSGRNMAVRKLVDLADILYILDNIEQTRNKQDFIRFCRYMEALVAYFKFHGGKD